MTATPSLIWIVVCAIVLGGGFAAGYMAGSGTSEDATVESLDHALRPAPRVERLAPRIESTDGAPVGPRLESARAAEIEPIRRVLETIPPPVVDYGTGVISGAVKTKAGEPIAGVEMKAWPRAPGGPQKVRDPEESDIPTMVRDFVDRARWRKLSMRKVLTGADGTYRFDDLTATAHSLRAQLDGWQIHPTQGRHGGIEPDAEVDFQAKRISRVRVQVYLPDGTQPKQARLQFKHGHSSRSASWRASSPDVRMDPGVYTVDATAGEAQEYSATGVPVTITPDGPMAEIRLDLKGRPVVKGTLAFPEGETLPSAQVRIARLAKGQRPDAALLHMGTQSAWVRTGSRSTPTFQFTDLATGRYLLGVARTMQGPIIGMQELEVGSGLTEVELAVPALKRGEYVAVRALGPDGKILPDVRITTGYRSKSSRSSGGGTIVDRPDGTKWVLHQPRQQANDEDGTYVLNVSHALYGEQVVEYAPGSSPDLEVRFRESTSLTLLVTGLLGTAYEGRISVSLKAGEGSGRAWGRRGTQKPDDKGQVRIEGIQPGDYDAVLHIQGGRFGGGELCRVPVKVGTGASTARVAMPALYSVTFEGVEGNGWLSGGDGSNHRMVSPTDGRAVVDALTAGSYTLHVAGKQVEFKVPGPAVVRVE